MSKNQSFFDIQTATAWGHTLASFADWAITPASPTSILALDVGCGPGLLPALLSRRGCLAIGADLEFMPRPGRLHPTLLQSDAVHLPFVSFTFNLITATNTLFLLPNPQAALTEMARLLRPSGLLALLDPSERMSVSAAVALADTRGLTGLDRSSLLGWAARAETHHRWDEAQTCHLLESAGFILIDSVMKVGPGLARWVKARPTGSS